MRFIERLRKGCFRKSINRNCRKRILSHKSVTNILINALLGNEVKEIDITARMNLNPKTIDNYRNSLFCKTNVKNRVGIVTYAVKNKIYTL